MNTSSITTEQTQAVEAALRSYWKHQPIDQPLPIDWYRLYLGIDDLTPFVLGELFELMLSTQPVSGLSLKVQTQQLVMALLDTADSTLGLSSPTLTSSVALGNTQSSPPVPALIQDNSVKLSADSGVVGDFITRTAAQTINATLNAALSPDQQLFGSVDAGKTWQDITRFATQQSISWTTTLLNGTHSIQFKTTDSTGKESIGSATTYTLDTAKPTQTIEQVTLSNATKQNGYYITNVTGQTIKGTLSGLLSPGEKLYGSLNDGAEWIDITQYLNGKELSWSTNLARMYNGLEFKIVDAAGNFTRQYVFDYKLDTKGPHFEVSDVKISNDTGSNLTDFITNTPEQTITATVANILGLDDETKTWKVGSANKLFGSLNNGTSWEDITHLVSTADGAAPVSTISWKTQLLSGSNVILFKVTDNLGNPTYSGHASYTLDSAIPSTPSGTHTVSISDDTGVSNTDRITSDSQVKVTLKLGSPLTLAADESLQISADGGLTWVRLTGSGTSWSTADNAVTLQRGSGKVFTARIIDTAGNISAIPLTDNQYSLPNDATPEPDTSVTPAPAGTHTVSISDDTGPSSTDRITSDSQVKVTLKLGSALTLAADESLQVSADGGLTWVKLIGSGTTWSTADNAVTLQRGSGKAFTARIIDTAGNVSALPLTGNQYSLQSDPVPDTSVTPAPAGPHSVSISDDTGPSNTDRITSDSQVKVTLKLGSALTLAADESLQVSADGGLTWVKLTGSGTTWATADNAVTLQSGSGKAFTARIVDTAGNTSALALSGNSYTLDSSLTPAPAGTHTVSISDDTGVSNTDRITSDSQVKVTLKLGSALTLAADESLQVSADGGLTWVTLTGSGTTWATADNAVTLQSGSGKAFTARIVDTAGNTSALALSGNSYTLDSSLTPAPAGTHTVSISDDTGVSNTDGITSDSQVKVTLKLGSALTLAADESLQVSADGGLTWVQLIGSGTTWSTADNAVTLQSGSGKAFTARIIDTAGNVSALPLTGNQYSLQSDPVPDTSVTPTPSGAHTVSISNDTGASNTDRITNDKQVQVTLKLGSALTLAADEVLQVSADGGLTWVQLTGSGTTWSTADNAVTLQSGSGKAFTARIVDTAGNTSALTLSDNSYTLDSSLTPTPSGTHTVSLSNDSGLLTDDRITNQERTQVTVILASALTLAADESLQISADGGLTWVELNSATPEGTIWATANNAVTLQSGSGKVFSARIVDTAGNTSSVTLNNADYRLDTSAPNITINDVRLSDDTGSFDNDFITGTASQTITAHLSDPLESNERLYGRVQIDAEWQDITAYVSGTNVLWSTSLIDGTHAIAFKVRDAAGNETVADSVTYTLNTALPVIGNITFSADTGVDSADRSTQTIEQTVKATITDLKPGDTLYGRIDDKAEWQDLTSFISDNTLTWRGISLRAGANELQFKVQNNVGKESVTTATYTLDTSPPPLRTIHGISLSADTGWNGKDLITNVAAQTITATLSSAMAADEVLLGSIDGGKTWNNITRKVNGTQITWDGLTLLEGVNNLQFKIEDRAGNQAPSLSARAQYTLDTTAPTQTISRAPTFSDSATGLITTDHNQEDVYAYLDKALGANETIYGSTDNGLTWTNLTNRLLHYYGSDTTTVHWEKVALQAGNNKLLYKIVDAAGNEAIIGAYDYQLNAAAPSVGISQIKFSADNGFSDSDFFTNTTKQTITATLSQPLSAGAKLEVSGDTGGSYTDITQYVKGTDLRFDYELPKKDALYLWSLVFRWTDSTGKQFEIGATPYAVETVAPTLSVDSNSVKLSDDTGSNASDLITRNAVQTITATLSNKLEQSSSHNLLLGSLDSGKTWTDITDKVNGTSIVWTGATLHSGTHSIQFKVVDKGGAQGQVTGSKAYTLDTIAPEQTVGGIQFSADSGISTTDLNTAIAKQNITATLSAALAANDKLLGSVDNGKTWVDITSKVKGTTISWDGIDLISGTNTLQFKVLDMAGQEAPIQATRYTYDNTAPTPTIDAKSVQLSDDRGPSATDRVTHTAAQTISATLSKALDPDDLLFASLDNGTTFENITHKVNGTGIQWEGVTLQEGVNNIVFKVIDKAGNLLTSTKGLTGQATVTLDTTAPTAVVGNISISADTGSSNNDRITNSAAQTITATLSSMLGTNERLWGSVSSVSGWTDITSSVSGTSIKWATSFTEGTHAIAFKVTDLAGNETRSTALSYTLDTAPPVVSHVQFSHDSGDSNTDKVTDIVAQTITATLSEALLAEGQLLGSVDGGASWEDVTRFVNGTQLNWNKALQGGTNTLQFKGQDTAGNSFTSEATPYTLNSLLPVATQVKLSADTGPSNTDRITKTAAQTIQIALDKPLQANQTLLATVDGESWTKVIDSSASNQEQTLYSWKTSLKEGSNLIQIKVEDTAGNAVFSGSVRYMLDTKVPTKTLGNVTLSADTGISPTDRITKQSDQTIRTTLSAALASDELLLGSVDNGVTWENLSNYVNGTNVQWKTTLRDGSSAIQFKVSDKAGNEIKSDATPYTVDKTAPMQSIVSMQFSQDTGSNQNDLITYKEKQTITATLRSPAQKDEKLYIRYGGINNEWQEITTTIKGNNLSWSMNLSKENNTISYKFIDTAGNESATDFIRYTLEKRTQKITFAKLNETVNERELLISAVLAHPLEQNDKLYVTHDGKDWTDITSSINSSNKTKIEWQAKIKDATTLKFQIRDSDQNNYEYAYQLSESTLIKLHTNTGLSSIDNISNDGRVLVDIRTPLHTHQKLYYRHTSSEGIVDSGWTQLFLEQDQTGFTIKNPNLDGIYKIETKRVDLINDKESNEIINSYSFVYDTTPARATLTSNPDGSVSVKPIDSDTSGYTMTYTNENNETKTLIAQQSNNKVWSAYYTSTNNDSKYTPADINQTDGSVFIPSSKIKDNSTYTVITTDIAGNTSLPFSEKAKYNPDTNPLPLKYFEYNNEDYIAILGNLIHPVRAFGKTHYFVDRNRNGYADDGDKFSWAEVQMHSPDKAINSFHWDKTIMVDGYKLTLPYLGYFNIPPHKIGSTYLAGTFHDITRSTEEGHRYSGMAALWDRFNGSNEGETNVAGVPPGWAADKYLLFDKPVHSGGSDNEDTYLLDLSSGTLHTYKLPFLGAPLYTYAYLSVFMD